MFARYLELCSVHLLQRELEQQGVRFHGKDTARRPQVGWRGYGCGAISHMLKNPLYVGMVRYQNELYEGQHEAIIKRELFEKVQNTLAVHGPGKQAKLKLASPALLEEGQVYDADGNRLQPTHCNKKGVRYHYYTSARHLRDAKDNPPGIRVPASDLERIVTNALPFG